MLKFLLSLFKRKQPKEVVQLETIVLKSFSQDLWEYIQNHQDENFYDFAKTKSLPQHLAVDLVFAWALGNRERFNEILEENSLT